MFGSEHIQHADNFLKANPDVGAIEFQRIAGGKAACNISKDDNSINITGSGDSLLDALKDALQKAGLDK